MSEKAVFLDLQGTLGGDAYGNITDFSFFDYTKEALRILEKCGFLLFVITNQSQIAKGVISRKDFDRCAEKLIGCLADEGIHITQIYVCPHQKTDHCVCRKPNGYFPQLAAKKYGVSLQDSYFIGDIYHSDIEMARNVGARAVLVLTGKGQDSLLEMKERPYDRVEVWENVLEAAKMIARCLGKEC